ncbi:MAG: glycosyltransferase family 4 protein [Candidatus Omnitrophica bacterium]|nr:glycosyltransferase family 4 protein [Candidatus Omnitrophota bacterium]
MNILIQNYYDYPVAGAESYLDNVISGLKKNGNKVVRVYTKSGSKAPDFSLDNDHAYYLPYLPCNFTFIAKEAVQNYSSMITKRSLAKSGMAMILSCVKKYSEYNKLFKNEIRNLERIIKEEQVDIIFLNNFDGLISFKLAKIDIPIVQMIHDYFCICPRIYKLLGVYKDDIICNNKMGAVCLKNKCLNPLSIPQMKYLNWQTLYRDALINIPDRILCNSSYVKLNYINNGVCENKIFSQPLFTNFNKNGDVSFGKKRKILFFGRISYEKGLSYLIKAIAGLNDFEMDIVGKGDDLENAITISKTLNLDKNIKFHGWMDHQNLSLLIKEARLTVVSSIWPEPFGLAGIESMAYGKPVVAFNVGGINEWLKDNTTGFLVKHKNLEQMKEKIQLLLSDEQLAFKMGIAAQKYQQEFLSEKAYMSWLMNFFNQTIISCGK